MPFDLYDYLNVGKNEFKTWTEALEKPARAKLNSRLDMLQQLGMELLPQILTGTQSPGILKLRVKGNVQLRPMLCRGPIDDHKEFTLLFGAKEVGNKLDPANADKTAASYRVALIADKKRRKKHERVS